MKEPPVHRGGYRECPPRRTPLPCDSPVHPPASALLLCLPPAQDQALLWWRRWPWGCPGPLSAPTAGGKELRLPEPPRPSPVLQHSPRLNRAATPPSPRRSLGQSSSRISASAEEPSRAPPPPHPKPHLFTSWKKGPLHKHLPLPLLQGSPFSACSGLPSLRHLTRGTAAALAPSKEQSLHVTSARGSWCRRETLSF